MSGQPNLLFVFTDQQRAMDMNCAGNAQVRTPNMDRLAQEGTRFAHAYANTPVCTPSRAVLLTGKYPLSNRVVGNDLPLPEREQTMGKLLQEAGYRTGYVGKWHLDGVPRNRFTPPGPRRQGFEYWAVWNCAHAYFNGRVFRDTPEAIDLPGYEPVAQTDLALEFLQRQDDRPFALFLSWGPPHDPYFQVPEEYRRLYPPEAIELRPNVREPVKEPPPLGPRDREAGARGCIANYYAHITALDEQLGRLLDALEQQGRAEDTLVVFTSDHGDMLWSQGMLKKQQPWEESAGIPLLARWPGRVPAGRVSETLVGIVDYAPTLLALLGLPVPKTMQGGDLSAHWLGDAGPGPESVFLMDLVTLDEAAHQGLREWRGVRTQRYTYARFIDGEDWLLYDNHQDPYQLQNLVRDPAAAPIKARLEEELQAWLQRTGDECWCWEEIIRRLDLVELWNAREHELHPHNPRLLV